MAGKMQAIQGTVEGRAERLAKRFAASDDMYEALEELWEDAQHWAQESGEGVPPPLRVKVETALARARGEE